MGGALRRLAFTSFGETLVSLEAVMEFVNSLLGYAVETNDVDNNDVGGVSTAATVVDRVKGERRRERRTGEVGWRCHSCGDGDIIAVAPPSEG